MAFPIAAIIDLSPGEGCLARAAYQVGIRYTGLTFNEAHTAGLRGRLESCIINDMIQEGHRRLRPHLPRGAESGRISDSGKRSNPGMDPDRRPKKKPCKKNHKGDQGGGQGDQGGSEGGKGGAEGGEGDCEDSDDDVSNDGWGAMTPEQTGVDVVGVGMHA